MDSGNAKAVGNSFVVKYGAIIAALFFLVEWGMLAIYDSSTLERIEHLSTFFFDGIYFKEMMSAPAGFLSYIGSFLVQFFYYPVLGAAIYVALLYLAYCLTIKVFDIPKHLHLVALVPVILLLATNTQLGYWIFYLKMPGYYFMALLAVIFSLLAMIAVKRLSPVLRIVFVVIWVFAGYPLMGVYALASALLIGIYVVCKRENMLLSALALVAAVTSVYFAPKIYYNYYTTVPIEHLYFAGVPCVQWRDVMVAKVEHLTSSYWHDIIIYWIPFFVLAAFYAAASVLASLRPKLCIKEKSASVLSLLAALLFLTLLHCFYWFNDNNYRIENKQNKAMWEQDWRKVADYARDATVPTRQVVMNKNIALLKMGLLGSEIFSYPDGSSDILAPMAVHLTQTGGMMAYFQYGKLNFCYRWCVENAVEYGWRVEYLKHAVRSMILSGEYRIAQRYIGILKKTLFHSSWAEEMEKFIKNPELIKKESEFALPLDLSCYPDGLEVDDSFVEMYLMNGFKNIYPEASANYLEMALALSMTRKDSKSFWYIFNEYLSKVNPKNMPRHFQEAFLLFYNLDKGQNVQVNKEFFDRFISKQSSRRFDAFIKKTTQYKGMKEADMAKYFKEEYGDTYFYFYFFVRKIRTN